MNEELRDIKPLLAIPDYTQMIFYGLITLAAVIAASILFFAVKRLLEYRRANLTRHYLAKLKEIDWSDPKASAYTATHYARLLATDTRRKELLDQLLPLLERYKYKKEVEAVDQDTLDRFSLFVQVADGSI